MLDDFCSEPIEDKKVKRLLSPTQITSFLACPRKWYYEYVERIKVPEKFPLVRGQVVHSVCEDIFKFKPESGWDYESLIEKMNQEGQSLLKRAWEDAQVSKKFGDDRWEETAGMIERFLQLHKWKMDPIYQKYKEVRKAWYFTRPKFRELHLVDEDLAVQGYIDAVIQQADDEYILVDYKTSTVYRHPVSNDHEQQLYIYALLFERIKKLRPKFVSVVYLLYGQVANYPVRTQFLEEVKDIIAFVHTNTLSKDIKDYRANTGYKFCKWCDFRETCQAEKPV